MIATLTIIAVAFYWLMRETDYLRIRLPMGANRTTIKLLPAAKPMLALPAGNPYGYPMVAIPQDAKWLQDVIERLSKTELELIEEVSGYDYSD